MGCFQGKAVVEDRKGHPVAVGTPADAGKVGDGQQGAGLRPAAAFGRAVAQPFPQRSRPPGNRQPGKDGPTAGDLRKLGKQLHHFVG